MAFHSAESALTLDTFLSNWCRWDSNHYINIAENGYHGAVEFCTSCRDAALAKGISPEIMENGQHLFLVFFPLYPFLLSLFRFLCSDIRIIGMFLSTIAYSCGCIYMFKLIKKDFDEKVAVNSIILLSLFPFSFFFGGIMTEGLFFFLSSAMLYYIRAHKWCLVILFGCLATFSRVQGALLIIPAGLELLCHYRPLESLREKNYIRLKKMLIRAFFLPLMFLGTGAYLIINWMVEGYPFAFSVYQSTHWHNGATLPTKTLSYVFQYAFSSAYDLQSRVALWIPEAILAIVCTVLLVYGFRKLRLPLAGYALSYVLLTYSVRWLISAGRYLSCCIPLFLVLALAAEKRKWLMTAFITTFSILQAIYLTGYLNGMQIM